MEQTVGAPDHREATPVEDRRGFFRRAAALAVGALVALVPGAASLIVFLDPLRRRKRSDGFVRVAPLDVVPADGVPRRFSILAPREDAWNRLPLHPVGAVYLRREPGSDGVLAHNAVCPHAGCFVSYQEQAGSFRCPCHDSRFARNGERIDPATCPSPRALDALTPEVREQQDPEGKPLLGPDGRPRLEVWVRFQNFRAGTSAKIALE